MRVEVDLSNHAVKTGLKNATGIDALSCGKKIDLANFKSNIGKLLIN